MQIDMTSKAEYSRLRNLMLKRIGRALEQKPQSKTLLEAQSRVKRHNVRDYFNALTEKQQNRALEALERMTENDKYRVKRKSTAKPKAKPKAKQKAKTDLEMQIEYYKGKRDDLLNRIKEIKNKPYSIDRYLSHAEKYLFENTPEAFGKLKADERFNKINTLIQMERDPLLTEGGMEAVVNRQKDILKRYGYEGGENWRTEWKDLQQKKKEQRQSTSDADIDEDNMEFWYHKGSPQSNAMMEEHNRRLGYI